MSLGNENLVNFDIHSDEFLHLVDSLESEFVKNEKKYNESCFNCGSDEIYVDSTEGKTVCIGCGLKLSDLLDSSTDWASINSTNDNNSRCGCPTNYYFPQSSLGTKAGNGKYSRISILESGVKCHTKKEVVRSIEVY